MIRHGIAMAQIRAKAQSGSRRGPVKANIVKPQISIPARVGGAEMRGAEDTVPANAATDVARETEGRMTAICLDPGKLPQCIKCSRNRQPNPAEFVEGVWPATERAPDTGQLQCVKFRSMVPLDA